MAISELQAGLLVAGGVAVAAVWAYNAWQERKHRQTAERLFKGEQADVLLKDVPVVAEPDLAQTAEPVADRFEDARSEPAERVEPTFGLPEPEPLPDVATMVATEPEPIPQPAPVVESAPPVAASFVVIDNDVSPADPFADCVVRFSLSAPAPAASVWAEQASWSEGISKPLMWLGRNPGEPVWRYVTADTVGRYSEWVAAVQLADRQGAVSAAEIGLFLDGLGQMGGRLGVAIDLPDGNDVLQRALTLDTFCASVDVQFGIHVVEASGGSFVGTKLRGVCEAAGLVLGTDGSFHSLDDNGVEEFRIANIGNERFAADTIRSLATHGVTLTIDVPRVAEGAAAFNRMITTAQQLARGLGGVLVDVQRAPLADAMIVGIRAKIIELQQQMKAADIPPGSVRALKLFA